jgi:hypothetical protein
MRMEAVHDTLRGRSSLLGAMCWMFGLTFLITALLGWVPVIGPFVGPILGGYVGGRRAGAPGRALLAAILPGLLLFAIIMLVAAWATGLSGVPIVGAAAAVLAPIALLIAVFHNAALFAAALVGGVLAQSEGH